MKEKFDVIIAGAGPASLECASTLAGSGKSVLIIEKEADPGKKLCGGGITYLAENCDIPETISRSFDSTVLFVGKKKYDVKFRKPLKVVLRASLNEYQYGKIRKIHNIHFLSGTAVTEIRNDSVLAGGKEYFFKYLVGADGSDSVVRKYLGLESCFCHGLAYTIKRKLDTAVWKMDSQRLGTGYLWIFPHHETVSAGVYFNSKFIKSDIVRAVLNDFLTEMDLDYTSSDLRVGKISCKYKGFNFGKIFLAGDAAGLPFKATGEGIAGALISGREIAKRIVNPEYKMPELKKYLRLKMKRDFSLKILETLPFMQNPVFRIYADFKKIIS